MKALVTGATGLIGSCITQQLIEDGHEVRALVRPTSDVSFLRPLGVELIAGDVTDAASLAAAAQGVDAIFHTVALVGEWGTWEDFERVGVEGARNVLLAAAAAGVPRFVHLSSYAVYGLRTPEGVPLTEEMPYEEQPDPWDHYVREKVASEKLVLECHRQGKLKATAIRPGVVWGPRDRAAFPRTVAMLRSPWAAIIGDGKNRVPSVAAADVAALAVAAAQSDAAAGEAFNCCGEPIAQAELTAAVAGVAGLKIPTLRASYEEAYSFARSQEESYRAQGRAEAPPITRFNVALVGRDCPIDTTKARVLLGWQPHTSCQDAIRAAAEWAARAQPA
jgi:nucleoside-diphosphate-sugar epimerase